MSVKQASCPSCSRCIDWNAWTVLKINEVTKRSCSTSIEYQLGTKWETKLWKLMDRDPEERNRRCQRRWCLLYRIPRHDFYWKEELSKQLIRSNHYFHSLEQRTGKSSSFQNMFPSLLMYRFARFSSRASVTKDLIRENGCWSTTTGRNPIAREINASNHRPFLAWDASKAAASFPAFDQHPTRLAG